MPDASLTLVIGGARSGKSTYAESQMAAFAPPWTYVATAEAYDGEMRERISAHRERRDDRWDTLDAPLDLAETLAAIPERQPVLIDCLTLWLSNTMLAERDVDASCETLAAVLAAPRGPWFVVSNEVGQGIVPDNALARRFRDAQGRLNQRIAAIADRVILVVAGLPLVLK